MLLLGASKKTLVSVKENQLLHLQFTNACSIGDLLKLIELMFLICLFRLLVQQ